MELGLARGLSEGISQGLIQGSDLKTIEFARKMKARGRPLEEIMEDTGLSTETIENL